MTMNEYDERNEETTIQSLLLLAQIILFNKVYTHTVNELVCSRSLARSLAHQRVSQVVAYTAFMCAVFHSIFGHSTFICIHFILIFTRGTIYTEERHSFCLLSLQLFCCMHSMCVCVYCECTCSIPTKSG